MYSAKVDGEPTSFGTSGLLYNSNKLMYDRATFSVWHQFTGEPVIGPQVGVAEPLSFFPLLQTTWAEWRAEHPDTTVLSLETGIYPEYPRESDAASIYHEYRANPLTMFPVARRNDTLGTKDLVIGVRIDENYKAYPVEALQKDRVVNDQVGDTEIVVVAAGESDAARVYRRQGQSFQLDPESSSDPAFPKGLVDGDGGKWQVTEEHIVNSTDDSLKLERIPTHTSFWFGWYNFHPNTEVYKSEGG